MLLNCTVPVTLLAVDAIRNDLGANPVNFANRTTVLLALIFLLLSLSTTPLGRLTGWQWLSNFRRTFGLYAFYLALLHLLIFFTFDRSFSISSTLSEILLRPYLAVGAIGLSLMVPLAVTFTNRMIKRLGATRWKRLHRLAYVAAITGVVHYYVLVMADVRQLVAFALALTFLVGYRAIVYAMKRRTGVRRQPATAAMQPRSRGRIPNGEEVTIKPLQIG